MKIHRLYTDKNGESHFEDVEVEFTRRQYIINLDAGVQITASDGEVRRIGAGEVFLVEDTWGKGHLSQALEGKVRHCIFVPVD
jgi:hypothetical protein